METPKAMAQIVWINTTMPWTLERSIQARIAGEALSMDYLKKIREDASAAYTCGALSRFFLADDGYHVGQLIAYCPMKPEKKDIAVKILNKAPIDLTEKCDAEVLEKIKKTMIKNYEDDLKTNNYWNEIVFDNYLMHQVALRARRLSKSAPSSRSSSLVPRKSASLCCQKNKQLTA